MNYDKVLSKTARELPPSGIRRFFDIVAKIPDAISLGVGEPDFITPWAFREDAISSIKRGYTQYTANSGLMELRKLIATYLETRFDLPYDPEREILVTVGASEAIDIALRALIESGDEILVPQPSFVSYAPCVTLAGGKAVPVECSVENDFKLLPQNVAKVVSKKTKAIILPYPNNPTGAIMEKERLLELAKVLEKYPDIAIISDEIYAELTYGRRHFSIAELKGFRERTILISGFSKAFAMTGWRLGYVCAPAELIRAMLKIHQYAIMCAPTASQFAGISALKNGLSDGFEVVEKMRDEYDRRRRFMVQSFNDMGLTCFNPLGAFYVFPCVASIGLTGETFAEKLLETQKVAVVPGEAFGECGRDFVRCSYAYSMKSLDTALSKIEKFVREIKK